MSREARPEMTAGSGGRTRLAALHAGVGIATVVLFLISGQYMRHRRPPMTALDPARHAMFLSRHIYMLGAALVNVALGAYLTRVRGRSWRALQLVASALVVLSAALLVIAFIVEPMAGRGRTSASSYGLYSLFAGTLLHFVASFGRTAPD
jgi:hypothetical protein